ncbi:MAG: hypothetical protein F4Y78_01960 [Candidatus Dadabacteria bacterium]|nr:hypothetical protein [Candidatus Dadabacteria bacterium]MYA47648.1 hypothetical protein [Candidatus Dadabacteria bacterium]MYG83167.1 hypothetical protein [Candidatus Dadabacteria bacterium]MYK49748.1 hypothetical protein [Candidatus Dadabacteria bacterium]
MSVLAEDSLIRLSFSIYENPGVYALLVGSGVSRAAEVPTGWEITLDLIRRIALAQGEKEQTDWVAWYRKKNGKEPDYSELISELGLSRNERRSILHEYIEPSDEDREEGRKIPTRAHYAIADLVRGGLVRVIITTNFDRLLENALREKGIEPTVVSSVDALKGAEPLTHANCYLLKLHGDYKDARILNTDAELSSYPRKYNVLLNRIFDEYGLLVCGWSGEWDHALREAIVRSPARRYSMFWTAIEAPGPVAQELIAHRKGQLVTIKDADGFFEEISSCIETIARTHRRNPQSVDLLVNSTKRYIDKPEHRIQLNELLASETRSLLEKLESADLSTEKTNSAEEVRRQVEIYEASVEPLARMVGVLGRWGENSECTTVINIIRLLLRYADRKKDGSSWLLSLRSYPAVLVVAVYGIGIVYAQRWAVLHRLLSEPIRNSYWNENERIVEKLFLNFWEGGGNSLWRNIEGLDRRETAFSDHLCDLLTRWGESFLEVVPNFEELYEMWEVLGSIAYCERYTLEDIQVATSSGNYVSMPVGRSRWNRRNRILEHIQDEDLKKGLLQAGFAKGQEKFFDATIVNFQRIAGGILR